MSGAAVRERVLAFGCPLVEITGGEPLLQADVYPLCPNWLMRARRYYSKPAVRTILPRSHRVHIILDQEMPR